MCAAAASKTKGRSTAARGCVGACRSKQKECVFSCYSPKKKMWRVSLATWEGVQTWCQTTSERNARDIVRFLRLELAVFKNLGGDLKGEESAMAYKWEFVSDNNDDDDDEEDNSEEELFVGSDRRDSLYGFCTDISNIDPAEYYHHLLRAYGGNVAALEHAAHLAFLWLEPEESLLDVWLLHPGKLPPLSSHIKRQDSSYEGYTSEADEGDLFGSEEEDDDDDDDTDGSGGSRSSHGGGESCTDSVGWYEEETDCELEDGTREKNQAAASQILGEGRLKRSIFVDTDTAKRTKL
jgi:hypothetical protein